MLRSLECPDPRLITVKFDACFVDVNHADILDILTDLLVLTSTGVRSALGRVPRGYTREFEFVQLLESVSNLSLRTAVIEQIER